jgi:hypothetical protein
VPACSDPIMLVLALAVALCASHGLAGATFATVCLDSRVAVCVLHSRCGLPTHDVASWLALMRESTALLAFFGPLQANEGLQAAAAEPSTTRPSGVRATFASTLAGATSGGIESRYAAGSAQLRGSVLCHEGGGGVLRGPHGVQRDSRGAVGHALR